MDTKWEMSLSQFAALTVTEQLRAWVTQGRLVPGAKIREQALALALGVSRTPVRAALHALASEGLLDYAVNRGFAVRNFASDPMEEAFEVRAALEGLAARFAATRGLAAGPRSGAEAALDDGEAVVASGRASEAARAAYRDANVRFHEAVLEGSGNRQLQDLTRLTLNRPATSHHRIVAFTALDIRRRVDDHRRILEAILARDSWRAELLMREHVVSIARIATSPLK